MSAAATVRNGETPATPSFDGRALRDAFGSFATGVTIVTTRGPDAADVGLTANSFSSVSLEPPMVLWSLARTSSNIDAFRESAHFAVHILSAEQDALSSRFASKGTDRFEGVAPDRGPGDIPMLPDCMARFVCRTAYQYEGGDHVIFVGEVLDFSHSARKPLVFHGGRYGMLLPKQAAPQTGPSGATSSLSPDDLLYHLSNAYFRIRREAIKERRRREWTAEEYAILTILGREDGLRVPEIAERSEARGRPIAAESILALVGRGLVQEVDPAALQAKVRLTAVGRQSVVELIAMLKASEADALGSFDPSEMQLLKHLLSRVGQG